MGFVSVGEPGAGHALAQAALFKRIFLQTAELLVNEVIGLVNQADGNVGDDFRRAGFHELTVMATGGESGSIGDIDYFKFVKQ